MYQRSWSQSGEDLIAYYLLSNVLGVQHPTYLDIGANSPKYLSNTYLLYQLGCTGVCVEPDPELAAAFAAARPRDRVVNIGVGASDIAEMEFYVFNTRYMNTFSAEQRDALLNQQGVILVKTIMVPLISAANLIDKHLGYTPDFVSLDTECFDLPILKTWDFSRHRPKVFCVETVDQEKDPQKVREIGRYLAEQGYQVYGDTFINTIFVETAAWRKRYGTI